MRTLHRKSLLLPLVACCLLSGIVPLRAECPQARRLGAAENFRRHPRVKIETGAFPNDGNELGSIWVVGTPVLNSGGPHFESQERCPSSGEQGWWKTGSKFLGKDSGIHAFVASPACLFRDCPPRGATLMTVLEDRTSDGSDAAFIAYMVDASPAGRRWYDHARTEPMKKGAVTTHRLNPFPRPEMLPPAANDAASAPRLRIVDFEGHAHVARGEENRRLSEGEAIHSLDLLSAAGQSDPGRSRSAWHAEGSLSFEEAATGSIALDAAVCGNSVVEHWVAVGVTFVDGVESRLVGRALKIDCLKPRVAG